MDKIEKYPWLLFIIWAVIVIFFWVTSIVILTYYFTDLAERGQFGDMFGAVNALFSGLALAGVIFAIHLQKKELKLQREELELTRTEIKG